MRCEPIRESSTSIIEIELDEVWGEKNNCATNRVHRHMRSKKSEARKPKSSIARLDAVLRDDPVEDDAQDHDDPETEVTQAEARARKDRETIGTKKSSRHCFSKRNYAEALHRQADLLHHRGNYESALILYHRAAREYPREASHGVAARRTAIAISSATNPSRSLRKALSGAKNGCQSAAYFCPETAALRARKIVEESSDPITSISQVLTYFDGRKDFWRDDSTTCRDPRTTSLVSKSVAMLGRLNRLASANLRELRTVFASGDFDRSLKIGDELITIAEALPNRYRYQVAARHYLAMTQISLGRHDRATDQVSRMIRLSIESEDANLRSRSFMTLGRVHLSHGHLDAAARAWERLVLNVDEAIVKAWMLHEIGRCYFEMKNYSKARETAERSVEYADESNSRKWLVHGKLLIGQALVGLGRLGEAVESLRVAETATIDEMDSDTRDYVSNLIARVIATLRMTLKNEKFERKDEAPSNDLERWNSKSIDTNTRRAKSEGGIKSDEQVVWLKNDRNNEKSILRSDYSENVKNVRTNCVTKKTMVSSSSRLKNLRKEGQKGRRNIARRGISHCEIFPAARSNLDLGKSKQQDINSSVLTTSTITRLDGNPRVADLSSRLCDDDDDDDEIVNDELTRRTRIIRTNDSKNERSRDQSLSFVGDYNISIDDDKIVTDVDEESHRTGKTYVIVDDTKKCVIERSCDFDAIENLDFYIEKPFLEKNDTIRVIDDNSKNVEFLWNDETKDLEVSLERDCSYGLGIDEIVGEKKKIEQHDDEASALYRHDVFTSRDGKLSGPSTAKTYVVDADKIMSLCEMPNCYVDRGKIVESEETNETTDIFNSSLE